MIGLYASGYHFNLFNGYEGEFDLLNFSYSQYHLIPNLTPKKKQMEQTPVNRNNKY